MNHPAVRCWYCLLSGFGWGMALANLVPAPPGRWPVMVGLAVICHALLLVGWLAGRYRIVERMPEDDA